MAATRVVRARYEGKCPACRGNIELGDLIMQDGKRWVHADCEQAAVEQAELAEQDALLRDMLANDPGLSMAEAVRRMSEAAAAAEDTDVDQLIADLLAGA